MFLRLLSAYFCLTIASTALSQTIGNFSSVQPSSQTQNLLLPSSHTFQRIIRSGAALTSGGTVSGNLDFTGYVPIGGSSTNGYLSISSETFTANLAILSINFSAGTKLWNVSAGGNVPFPQTELGLVNAFCAGTVTPNNHIMVCEETTFFGDGNGDGYNDDGWILEIDPATRSVINQDAAGGVDKLWAMGRQAHEDVVIKADQSVAYWSADNSTNGFVYKFVPAAPGNFSSGQLYVLKTNSALGIGTWEAVANTSQADRNNTISLSNTAGAYNFSRVEGIEIGPDGKVYFASTTSGNIYRFRDQGSSVDQLEVFVESTNYDVDGAGPYPPVAWGAGADNIAFDGEGNLWVQQDGGNNYIWVVAPDHTAANPKVRLFAIIPTGGEPTGITFSPDYKFLFMSVQHPSTSNTASQPDAAGTAVVFDESTTIVIARKENLGNVALPVTLAAFDLRLVAATVEVNWHTTAVSNDVFIVERSIDGVHFTSIGTVKGTGTMFRYVDQTLPVSTTIFYRLKQTDLNGKIAYSVVKSIRLANGNLKAEVYPSPVNEKLTLRLPTLTTGPITVSVVNAAGAILQQFTKTQGQTLEINTSGLPAGIYHLLLTSRDARQSTMFVKQ